MSLALVVELVHGSYDAASDDPWRPEWPPHPARVFCALLASGQAPEDLRSLRWLEAQGAPLIQADPDLLEVTRMQVFVVTNKVESSGRHQTHPGRRAVERIRTGCVPRTGRWAFTWPHADPDPDVLATLQLLGKRVPYIGRSTALAIVTVERSRPVEDPSWAVWEPLPAVETMSADVALRVPWPGYTDALVATHESDGRAREVARDRPYQLRRTHTPLSSPTSVRAPHDSLVVLGFPAGLSVPGEHSGLLTQALRRTVMSRAPDPLPATLSGHDADGQTHVAFLPLLDVGHRHARGHALGVAVALPRDDEPARRAVGEALDESSGAVTVVLPSGIEVELERHDLTRSSAQLQAHTWTRPASIWTTVTPLVLDLFPKGDPEDEVRRMCEALGLPAPIDLLLSPAPLLSGAARLLRRHLPRPERRPVLHARLTFPVPVAGPLLLGAQRYLGIGLCRPTLSAVDD